jgi:hypothetical protein
METQKYHTFGTIPKSNIKLEKGVIAIALAHKYMTANLVQVLQ